MLRGDGEATHLVSIELEIIPLSEAVVPPFTGKVVKSIVEILGLFGAERSVGGGYKPFSLTPLFLGERPIYKKAGDRGIITLRRGVRYWARVSAMVGEGGISSMLGPASDTEVATPYGPFRVLLSGVELHSLDHLRLGVEEDFKLEIYTPMLLSNKLMTPPNLSAKDEIPSMHKLLPTPSYIFSYLARLWNANVKPELRLPRPGGGEWAAYKIGRIADLVIVEVNYRLKPITILYDKKGGKQREIRGCTGWIQYKLLHPKPRRILDKLLALANYMGIGRSRGIGMGHVKIKPIKPAS